jgi:DNA-binding PadR family transcriptional regulator
MGKGRYPGEFELVVLSTLARLGPEAYGMRIRLEIVEATGRDVSIGAVYATLNRLEDKGLIGSETGQPSRERGGRAKRFFHLLPEGARALERARRMFDRLWAGLPESLA